MAGSGAIRLGLGSGIGLLTTRVTVAIGLDEIGPPRPDQGEKPRPLSTVLAPRSGGGGVCWPDSGVGAAHAAHKQSAAEVGAEHGPHLGAEQGL